MPTPLMSTRVAFCVVQDNVEDSPETILVGVASNRMMSGFDGCGAPTVTVTVAVADLPLPVAVKVYVVVVAGVTVEVPCNRRLSPTPGAMLTEVAPVTFHSSNEDWPAVMLVGVAENLTMTISGTVMVVTVVRAVLCRPPLSFTVSRKL